jgi:polar amino acid transport system substrate-binding protein
MNPRLFIFLSLLAPVLPALAEDPVVVLYSERPPFMTKRTDGSLAGIAAGPAIASFTKASIPVEIREASPNRRLASIKENSEAVCSVGLYKTPEREAYARFSKPVSRDGKMIALANSHFRFKEPFNIDNLLSDPDITVLVKQHIFYGPFLDAKFDKMKSKKIDSTAEYSQLLRLIKIGRAQLIFLPEEEAQFYLKEAGYATNDFKIFKFPEMPMGELRYVMCSLKVGESIMQRLNKGISFLEF